MVLESHNRKRPVVIFLRRPADARSVLAYVRNVIGCLGGAAGSEYEPGAERWTAGTDFRTGPPFTCAPYRRLRPVATPLRQSGHLLSGTMRVAVVSSRA
ncbi:hypothetical protein GCM10009601_53370 [Streptomyces thermospinosisporus]|uniref:Uncharacterized protein n=1 Tax=Streptomyces thermospinosisporus TaxID=161482 RepID=A0ABN1Z596_9ACTN